MKGKKGSVPFVILVVALLITGSVVVPPAAKWVGDKLFGDNNDDTDALTAAADAKKDDLSNDDNTVFTKELGASATLLLDAYTGTWGGAGSKTEVYPTYTIFKDGSSSPIVNDVAANSTTSVVVGDTVDIYVTGASYYMDPVMDYEVDSQKTPSPSLETQAIVAKTDVQITCYDADTESTALTADDNASNTADYAGGNIGADENNMYLCKIKNNVADKTLRIGAILTYYCGDEVDDFTMEESGWTSVALPKGVTKKTFTLADDTAATTACSFKEAYIPPGGFIELQEWEDTGKMKFLLDAASSQPTANGDSYVGFAVVDYACEQDKTGETICDWYKHDDNGDPGEVGLDEAPETTGFKGLNVGVAIEPQ